MRNTGTLPISSWTVTFKVPNGLSWVQMWNGGRIPPGGTVTVPNQPWNGALPPGASVTTDFAIGWSGGTVGAPSPITCTAT
ncbi:cellulose binding domain-containing protein [Microbispora triticiradicis]|uniref:cellulose binding domain-containing protein n=1 Tax=Microbispora triticiradicis TaxID=2200763 RepID=UPI0014049AF5|nr:cellulose binding domain-containing protein [Microbispora triticiradicis]